MEPHEIYELGFTILVLVIVLYIMLFAGLKENETKTFLTLTSDFIDISNEEIQMSIKNNNLISKHKQLSFYNMSVIKEKNGFKGVVRASSYFESPPFSYAFYINLSELGDLKNMNLIELDYENMNECKTKIGDVYANGLEDPKLFLFKGEEWIAGNCLGNKKQKKIHVNQMCFFKVKDPKNTFQLIEPPIDKNKRQKNWTFFENRGDLLCEYSLSPHIILKVDVKTGNCSELCRSVNKFQEINRNNKAFRFNGNPIFLEQEDFYLGIGHVKISNCNYFHFFYTFESKYPFNIINISKEFKLETNEKIQFVGSISEYEGYIYISYGINDKKNRISKFDLNEVIKMLTS